MTMLSPVLTGATGAFGKVENIKTLSLAPIDTAATNYKLTIGYKVSSI